MVSLPSDVIERRRTDALEGRRQAQDRWTRFQAASRRRYEAVLKRRAPPWFARLMARAKTPGRMLLLADSGVWDKAITQSLGSSAGPTAGLFAYVAAGPDAAFQPRALFDQSWYLANAPGIADSRWPPLAHYLVVGDGHNLSPHPLLDARAYRARHGAEMTEGRPSALQHFLARGAAEGADPHPLFDVVYYVAQCEEVAASGENPLIHYLKGGWRQGLEPNPLFAGAWYLQQNPDAADAGVAPLLHYVTVGAAEGRDPHPLFSTAHYRRQRMGAPQDALSHFFMSGARQLKSPTRLFNPAFYLQQTGGDPQARTNPLVHYLTLGAFEGLWPAPDFDEPGYWAAHADDAGSPLSGLEHWLVQRTERPPIGAAAGQTMSAEALFSDLRTALDQDPEAYDNDAYLVMRRRRRHEGPAQDVRVIAIRRMTPPDWTKVAGALPNFRGHLQPRLPAQGFADPADLSALIRDVALARRYGLSAFCHEVASAEAVKALTGPKFPYCLAWAGAPDAKPALEALKPALAEALRADGRPIVLANPDIDPAAWRKAAGKGGLYLVQRGGEPKEGFDARLADADAPRAPEGPPGPVVNPDFRGAVHDARAAIDERIEEADEDALPLVICARDTTPLSQDGPVIWHGASPGAFQAWLEAAIDRVRARPKDEQLVFVHAWNDWESGAAIAPDRRFGHGWLEAVANAADADLLTPPEDEP